jgi:hypothetical protein
MPGAYPTVVRRPIILLGFARSGTTMLNRVLRAHPDVAVMIEPRTIWMTGHAYRGHDALAASDLTPRIARRIDRRFAAFLEESGRTRFAEKTPSNCLRVGFVHALYPDCRMVHIVRDGRAVVRSLLQVAARSTPRTRRLKLRLRETPVRDLAAQVPLAFQQIVRTRLLGQPARFWGPRPPGWKELLALPPHLRAARQWRTCVEAALRDGRALPAENYLELRYEEFVRDPATWTRRILDFVELSPAPEALGWAQDRTDSTRGAQWKGTLTADQEREVEQEQAPLLERLGYLEPARRSPSAVS